MPTVSEIFANTRDGLPDFYQTMDRPQGEIGVDGHDELLNYRYVGGEVFIRAEDSEAVAERLSGADFNVSSVSEPESMGVFPRQHGLGESPDSGPLSPGESAATVGESSRIRVVLEEPTHVPDVVDDLINANISASPHHVYVCGNHTQFGPADAPKPISKPPWVDDFVEQPRPTGSLAVIIDTGLLPRNKTESFPFHHIVNPFDNDTAPFPVSEKVPPYVGHGTFVAGRILQQSPTSQIVMVRPKNMRETADGESLAVDDDDLASALLQALAQIGGKKAAVLNMSLSGPAHSADALTEFSNMRVALTAWLAQGTLIVASAGNEHSNREHYPGAWDDVICVGARDATGKTADYSNRGPWVDIEVLGDDTESWHIKDARDWSIEVPSAANIVPARRHKQPGPWSGFAKWSGTSFAAPYVAGLIARQV